MTLKTHFASKTHLLGKHYGTGININTYVLIFCINWCYRWFIVLQYLLNLKNQKYLVMDQPRADGSMDCPFDRLPLDIIFDILSRLSVSELSTALESYVAWQRIVLTSDQHSPGPDLCFFNNNSNVSYFFETKCWLLQGAADGLLLFIANDFSSHKYYFTWQQWLACT